MLPGQLSDPRVKGHFTWMRYGTRPVPRLSPRLSGAGDHDREEFSCYWNKSFTSKKIYS